ncbi:thioredoxin family protein [Roseobacter sp. HKCCA0434]|uniref:thioredoxin family protein n=1 Tax=Roseobacter sp. HKCCA0434 TaxID=3079297 RepID=UPI002905CE5B|nr:thioredoxin family protein [Roseobacter sp. HKCCA0434]
MFMRLATLITLIAAPLAAETRLLMAEQKGCIYCRAWNEEIGPAWPNTPEGAAAPLMRMDIDDPVPEGIELDRAVILTPTFILLEDGQELARLEGYAGDEFFWHVIGTMMTENGIAFGAEDPAADAPNDDTDE